MDAIFFFLSSNKKKRRKEKSHSDCYGNITEALLSDSTALRFLSTILFSGEE